MMVFLGSSIWAKSIKIMHISKSKSYWMYYLGTIRNAEGESTCLAQKFPADLPQTSSGLLPHNQLLTDSDITHIKIKHTPFNKQ